MYYDLAGYFTVTEAQLLFPAGDTYNFELSLFNRMGGTDEPYATLTVGGDYRFMLLFLSQRKVLSCSVPFCLSFPTFFLVDSVENSRRVPIPCWQPSCSWPFSVHVPRVQSCRDSRTLRQLTRVFRHFRCACTTLNGRQDLESTGTAEYQSVDLTGVGEYVTSIAVHVKGSGESEFPLLDAKILGTKIDNPTDTFYVSAREKREADVPCV